MIDAGINRVIQKRYREMVADGFNFSKLQAILLTHSHQDHIRGISYWIRICRRNVPVFVGAFGVSIVKKKEEFARLLNIHLGNFYHQVTRIPHRLGDPLAKALWGDPSDYDNVHAINDEQIWDLGGVTITAYTTPGHNPDHVVFEVNIDGDCSKYLLSGDLISFKDMSDGHGLVSLASFNNPFSSVRDEINSLKRVLSLSPDVLLAGHARIFEGEEVIQNYITHAIGEALFIVKYAYEILEQYGPISFRELTKRVVFFRRYLSGINTRENSMFVILREMEEEGMIQRSGEVGQMISLIPEKMDMSINLIKPKVMKKSNILETPLEV
jgi:glyoxylase-like metal-dependent hydrolase (beta-lactamase superfamily II)